jgi:hypothetical protein
MQFRLPTDIVALARLELVEQQEALLTGQRPALLTPEEREFLRWWTQAWASRPLAQSQPHFELPIGIELGGQSAPADNALYGLTASSADPPSADTLFARAFGRPQPVLQESFSASRE